MTAVVSRRPFNKRPPIMSHDEKSLTVRIHINQHPYHSPRQSTGVALYHLGHIQPGYILFREVRGDQEDLPVPNNEQPVHLQEDEHFHSAPEHHHEVTIVVNTEPVPWSHRKITYDQAVKIAYPNGPFGGDVRYSVMWTKPDGQEGILRPGHSVHVVNDMVFDVRNTDKS
jgi:hypothetical protein